MELPDRYFNYIPALAPPLPARPEEATTALEAWSARAARMEDEVLRHFMQHAADEPAIRALLDALFGNSPYLSRLAIAKPALLKQFVENGADYSLASINHTLGNSLPQDQASLMQRLRQCKGDIALLCALADITAQWPLEMITKVLSEFAETALQQALDFLLLQAHGKGEIILADTGAPSHSSGIVVLGMGKLGAHELNYSSDIDLIIFYERERLAYRGKQSEQKFYNKLAHDLVHIMQERTPDGYVFRTDLRLRPDPASTPPAISVAAAYYYYESVGQNWERAAMIKARPVAGDIAAGEQFMQGIAPFIWRRHLDFAAINDIHSIKRQMDTRTGRTIAIGGHNVKLGLGGIREIEFFAQVNQLIWGGREKVLRPRGTVETLQKLAELKIIEQEAMDALLPAYSFLRTLEHRLQMVEDQQTHVIPESSDGIHHIALFMGFENTEEFTQTLLKHLHRVHDIFANSFKSAESLGETGNLVFTGVSHDPDTLATLVAMGYRNPTVVSECVMGWHHGSRRCTRTKRARELLTELMPALLKRLSETANPDEAFLKFDEFLARMPAGVQLFSLFTVNPQLLGLIADIMGSAPVLAETLSRHPDLLDSVLFESFYASLPARTDLKEQLGEMLSTARDFEDRMETLRRFKNEKHFQAGVQLLKGMIDAAACGLFLSALADVILQHTFDIVAAAFAGTYGNIPRGRFCILAFGKLGSEELTFGSDIDLIFVYDAPEESASSDGEKALSTSIYYNRLAQRLHNAITAIGKEGRLYEVDTRLKPSGTHNASSMQAMHHYFNELAWTFEFMALTKARACAGDDSLMQELEAFRLHHLRKPRDVDTLKRDVADMRERVRKEFPPENLWDLKYALGGMLDLDFFCQYLFLAHAHACERLSARSSHGILNTLTEQGLLSAEFSSNILNHNTFLIQLFNLMRLCVGGSMQEETALPGLRSLLARATSQPDFSALKSHLERVEAEVYHAYATLLGTTSPDAGN